MSNDELIRAIDLIKSNKKQDAFVILSTLVKKEPRNELVWLWLSTCLAEVDQKKFCLHKVLELNPLNDQAKKALEQINTPPTPSIEEIIKPNIKLSSEYPKKRNRIKSCLLSCSVILLLTLIVGGLIIYNWYKKTSSTVSDVFLQVQSEAVCKKYNAEFWAETVIELGDNRYQADGTGYRCIYKLHPEMETEEDRLNPYYGAIYLYQKYGQIESFEKIK